ncbi:MULTISPECIES: DNA-3-methyladenine glycosylase [unclassified Cryobacterium]|uniref:DNA-3-methyladenine glycosylase n=1 Tax=unclassified Cryobacterium TaxID=2649013 RepID=UPI00106B0FBD|nr:MULTISPECIES: DNA-3-methyladenine glycosylase [unclassified Cryobacterium]TFC54894.1 DNA-3-methyladenine glycosylase [Cryobacterium sp. TMB3-1-2]TFC70426.1 DNA-3-methyladenine glycosylase [Cryobacterium sp. TMB3-15]TFC75767.1 DNA-3-methyladenine glycosylase [Cryobacterium sp. TMB3-10]TFD37681.1 DNA-3-methyladenine glycosylase [Cryobacterium sp. TMB3-12]
MTVDPDLFARGAVDVAPLLLGGLLRHGDTVLRITEVEAYLAGTDPGSHAFRRRTDRNTTMFGPPGHLYAYFSYGMHVCANIVCSPEGEASAVLLRAGEIVAGHEAARARRGPTVAVRDLARGPARLTQALGIGLHQDGADLGAEPFELSLAEEAPAVQTGPRTGVSGPGGGTEYAWRFWIPGDRTVSAYRRHPHALQ